MSSWLKVCALLLSPPVLLLFDYGTPKGLARALSGHTIHTAQAKGWDVLSNGALLNAAEEAGFELLLTTDRRIRYQQAEPLPASVYFKPSFFPATSSAIDSRMRRSRVSARLAI